MSWWHLPVKDGFPLEYPGDGFMTPSFDGFIASPYEYIKLEDLGRFMDLGIDRWTALCALLRTFLHQGGRVLIHCRGGLGRTGTLATRLLIEDGVSLKTALRKVRRVRPSAVETEIQEKSLHAISFRRFGCTGIPVWAPSEATARDAFSGIPQSALEDAAAALLAHPERFDRDAWAKSLRPDCACLAHCGHTLRVVRNVGEDRTYHGDMEIYRCGLCGRYWLHYHVAYAAYTKSGRWFEGLISREKAEALKPDEALAYLCSLDWYFRGGPYFLGRIDRTSGPVRAGLCD
jgi:hypothetical protein